jgi:hypothetical protein
MRAAALGLALSLSLPVVAAGQEPSGSSARVNGATTQSGLKVPRSVGGGITMVPGAVRPPVASTSSTPPVAPQRAPTASDTQPRNAASEVVDGREEFIKRSVMQSICRGC